MTRDELYNTVLKKKVDFNEASWSQLTANSQIRQLLDILALFYQEIQDQKKRVEWLDQASFN